jgi:hypothetical protein
VADIVKEVGGKPIIAESPAIRIDSELVREDDRLKIEGLNLIYGNTTCSGWRMGIMSSIFDMKVANQLRKQGNDFSYNLIHDLVRKRANFSMPSSNMERSAA